MHVISNTTVLITGATGGIGRAICQRLAHCRLLLVDLDASELATLVTELPNAQSFSVDFSQPDSAQSLANWLDEKDARVDVAILNAGIVVPSTVLDTSAEAIDQQIDINLRSTIQCLKRLAQHMQQHSTQGHLITTVSMGGILALKGSALYSATKFGLRGFLTAFKSELKPLGIKVTGLYLSAVDTPMLRFEANNHGSPLNFLSRPMKASRVAKLVERAIKRPRLEVYAPYSDSLAARLAGFFPWMIEYLYPVLSKLGEKGRRNYLNAIQQKK